MLKKKKTTTSSTSSTSRPLPPFRDLSELSNTDSFVIYGRSGSGKTTLAGSFPGPILFLDCKDRGTDSLDPEEFEGKVVEIKSWDDWEATYWWLKNKENRKKFGTVVIDTVSQLQQLAVIKVLEDKGKDTERAGDWGTMTKQDWGTVSSMMKSSITNFRDLRGIKKVAIAQDRTFNINDEETAEDERLAPEVGPRLSPATASHLNAEFYFIGNTFIRMKDVTVKLKSGKKVVKEKPEYCLRIGPNPVYITKVRKAKSIQLPPVIVDPTYDKIMEAVKPGG